MSQFVFQSSLNPSRIVIRIEWEEVPNLLVILDALSMTGQVQWDFPNPGGTLERCPWSFDIFG